jgi:hypothetical protein
MRGRCEFSAEARKRGRPSLFGKPMSAAKRQCWHRLFARARALAEAQLEPGDPIPAKFEPPTLTHLRALVPRW